MPPPVAARANSAASASRAMAASPRPLCSRSRSVARPVSLSRSSARKRADADVMNSSSQPRSHCVLCPSSMRCVDERSRRSTLAWNRSDCSLDTHTQPRMHAADWSLPRASPESSAASMREDDDRVAANSPTVLIAKVSVIRPSMLLLSNFSPPTPAPHWHAASLMVSPHACTCSLPTSIPGHACACAPSATAARSAAALRNK